MNYTSKPKVIVVGAGVAGLTTGIYLLDNGFDVEIYEKHYVPGGECTGWYRKGQYIDGCAHWIVGTEPSSELYPLWEHVGAFDGNPEVFPTEYLTKFQLSDGRFFTFYSDLDKLENEFLTFFPEDKRAIKRFLNTVKVYRFTHIPVKKPLDLMNWFQYIAYGLSLLPMALPFAHYKHVSLERYIRHFKNEDLKSIFLRFLDPGYNIHSFFYVCQTFSKGDAGVVEGGSLAMMQRVAENFKRKGGKLFLSTPVDEVLVNNKTAYGIRLASGEELRADYVVAATDAHYTLNRLLRGKVKDKGFERQFKDSVANPVHSSMMLDYRTTHNMTDYPRMMDFMIDEPFDWMGCHYNHFAI
jgi:phytoene dehydrogenase-like protein